MHVTIVTFVCGFVTLALCRNNHHSRPNSWRACILLRFPSFEFTLLFKCAAVQTDTHQLCLEHYGNSEILKDFPITGLCLCYHKRKCTLCVQLKSRHSNHFLATAWEQTHPMIGPHVGCRLAPLRQERSLLRVLCPAPTTSQRGRHTILRPSCGRTTTTPTRTTPSPRI